MTTDFYCDYVLNNKIAVERILETADVLVYKHTKPNWRVHYVLTPKKHVLDLYSCEQSLVIKIINVIKKISKQLVKEYGACRVLTNFGEYQDSKHLHWHLYVE